MIRITSRKIEYSASYQSMLEEKKRGEKKNTRSGRKY